MSHTSTGTILKLPNGKYVRAYQTQTHTGTHEYIQATPDIYSATVFRPMDRKMRIKAEQHFKDFTELTVEVTRTIKIIQEGDQPCLPL